MPSVDAIVFVADLEDKIFSSMESSNKTVKTINNKLKLIVLFNYSHGKHPMKLYEMWWECIVGEARVRAVLVWGKGEKERERKFFS